jgi:hypothetical protein
MDVARSAGYQLSALEREDTWRDLAETLSVVDLIGEECWMELGLFTRQALDGLEIEVAFDERGPYVSVDEIGRLSALVLVQYLAGKVVY